MVGLSGGSGVTVGLSDMTHENVRICDLFNDFAFVGGRHQLRSSCRFVFARFTAVMR